MGLTFTVQEWFCLVTDCTIHGAMYYIIFNLYTELSHLGITSCWALYKCCTLLHPKSTNLHKASVHQSIHSTLRSGRCKTDKFIPLLFISFANQMADDVYIYSTSIIYYY